MTYRPTFLAVLLVGASILACSSQDGDSPSAPCAHRHDYYYKRYSSSSCFPLWEGTTGRIEVDNQRTEPEDLSSECAGSITYSADNCVETQEITCQEADGPSTSREVIYWSADGRHGTFAAEGDGCSFQGTFAKFGTSEACAALAQEIAARAGGDQWLINMGRQADPCADPVAVTNTDYRPACAQLDQCLCEAGQKQHC